MFRRFEKSLTCGWRYSSLKIYVYVCLGGTFCSLEDKIFTHVVVENCVEELPPEAMELSLGSNVKIVKQEVFLDQDIFKGSGYWLFYSTLRLLETMSYPQQFSCHILS